MQLTFSFRQTMKNINGNRINAWLLMAVLVVNTIAPSLAETTSALKKADALLAFNLPAANRLFPVYTTVKMPAKDNKIEPGHFNSIKNSSLESTRRPMIKVPEGGGPSMPEVQGFTPASADKLVDLSTGDLTYNIPLLDVGGYPVNLAYNSGIGVNDEASWVGLGWTLNPGAINRNVRGLPDDFNGDKIERKMSIKEKVTAAYGPAFGVEYAGAEGVNISAGGSINMEIEEDNYEGVGVKTGMSGSVRFGPKQFGGSLGLGMGLNSRGGGYLNPNLGLSGAFSTGGTSTSLGAQVGMHVDSREGLKQISFGINAQTTLTKWSYTQEKGEDRDYEDVGMPSFSANFPLNFSSPSFTPPFEISSHNSARTFTQTIGGEVNSVNIHGDFMFSLSRQNIIKVQTKPAFGYMYAQAATPDGLLDLNREGNEVYQKELPTLQVTAFTHDLYSISGQGIGGVFRPMRMDIGTLHDPYQKNTSNSIEGSVEAAFGNLVKFGGDIDIQNGNDIGQKWIAGNHLEPAFQFRDNSDSINYEPVYFKNLGETTAMEDTLLFNKLGGFTAVRAELSQSDPAATGDAIAQLSNGEVFVSPSSTTRTKREYSNQRISWRTNGEMNQSNTGNPATPLSPYYTIDYRSGRSRAVLAIVDKPANLIEEMTVASENGSRYLYGLPAYNNFITEVSFNVHEDSTEDENGLVGYTLQDASENNTNGEDHFYSSTKTPTHAYAWLLTHIVSNDFEDLDNNGPSPLDLGSYTSFKYIQTHNDYKWRTPVNRMKANFQEAMYHTHKDNKGSYVYGGKEIYYLNRIETRNYIAEFYTSPRLDGLGVLGETGGISGQFLNKLDSIKLFTRTEYQKDVDRVPLKAVHFQYDYSLCTGVPNTLNITGPPDQQGKLTLKKLYFTYGHSKKHKESPYVFYYHHNPQYDPSAIDRWGNYKNDIGPVRNDRFPYSTQQKSFQDIQAQAWLMDSIRMPMGGSLKIMYESDDYAHVQNRNAQCMFKIIGLNNQPEYRGSNHELYTSGAPASESKRYLFFDLLADFPGERSAENLFGYFKDINQLYFNLNLEITNEPGKYTEVTGFVPLELQVSDFGTKYGYDPVNPQIAWFQLPMVLINPNAELNYRPEYRYIYDHIELRRASLIRHPFTQAGFEYLRMSLPRLISHRAEEEPPQDLNDALNNLGAAVDEVFSGGTFTYLQNHNRCRKIELSTSFIRLNHPAGRKLGGGSRVKKVILHDNWGNMQRDAAISKLNFQYGVEYDYMDGSRSSGVTAYEPMIGADENPFTEPIPYQISRPMAIDYRKYILAPVGGIFFPAPLVIYSKVTQKNLSYDRVTRHGMGYTVTEYYTAKDFPTKTSHTDLKGVHKSFTIPLQLYNQTENTATVSQGFVVELNNMHGKLKSIKEFDQYDNLISSSTHLYKTDASGGLDNYVKTVNPGTGEVSSRLCGVQYECIVDANNYIAYHEGNGVQLNLDLFWVGPALTPLFVALPVIHRMLAEYRGITFTKVITRTGLLQSITTTKLGARAESKNIAYDPHTGQVIVSEHDNEFNKKYYSTNLPAHWTYKNMGHASTNEGLQLSIIRIVSGQVSIPRQAHHFTAGDELRLLKIDDPAGDQRAWVFRVSGNQVSLIKDNGDAFGPDGNYNLKIVKSGYRNILNQSVGSYTNTINPVAGDTLDLNAGEVVQSQASTYSDYWHTDFAVRTEASNGICNCVYNRPVNLFPVSEFSGVDLKNNRNPNIHVDSNRILFVDPNTHCEIIIITEDGRSFITEYIAENLAWIIPTEAINNCTPAGYLQANLSNSRNGRSISQRIRMMSDCFPLVTCSFSPGQVTLNCGTGVQNPFLSGILGHYRPLSTYAPVVKRSIGRIGESGYFETYSPFWRFTSNGLVHNERRTSWQRADSVTVINSRGKIQEAVNALNIPASTFFQFGKLLPAAIAGNAHYTDMAYDGFEDRVFNIAALLPSRSCRFPHHFIPTFETTGLDILTLFNPTISHSGRTSLQLNPGTQAFYSYKVGEGPASRPNKTSRLTGHTFTAIEQDILMPFAPRKGINYVFSAWVHQNNDNVFDASVAINGRIILKPSGPVVDGWQQINGEFIPQPGEGEVTIKLISGTQNSWFDDVRIHPFASSMQSFAYSASRLRLDARQDDQNFTSFFEYDDEGKLVRSKKETEAGIFTIQEARTELPKIKP